MSDRADTLISLVHKHGWTRGVELGLWRGSTTHALLSRCPGLTLVGVDLWDWWPRNKVPIKTNKQTGIASYCGQDIKGAERECRERLVQFGSRMNIIKDDTCAAALYFKDYVFDFVFIDACHEEDSVRRDINAWKNKIQRSSGALTGHDIDWPSVRRAVSALCPAHIVLPGNVWFAMTHALGE